MTSKHRASAARKRKPRSRPTPRWLVKGQDLDLIAQRRCLMVLSVLSGERPVTEAIGEAKISRGFYYQLETRALMAMLRALTPGTEVDGSADATLSGRLAALEAQVKRLQQEKRRAERMLLLTRKLVKPGPVSTGAGRPPRSRSSTTTGGRSLPSSRRRKPMTTTTVASTPMPAGEPTP